MKIPFDGNVSARLVQKRYEGTIVYYVFDQQGGKGYKIGYGFLKVGCIEYPSVRYFDKDNNLSCFAQGCSWDMIFETHDDAKKKLKGVESLYSDGFSNRPFIRREQLSKLKPDLVEIEIALTALLSDRDDFKGISFIDVSARGIQVMACGCSSTINYDLSNKVSVITDYIEFTKQECKNDRP